MFDISEHNKESEEEFSSEQRSQDNHEDEEIKIMHAKSTVENHQGV
jgi:hypothetical protein